MRRNAIWRFVVGAALSGGSTSHCQKFKSTSFFELTRGRDRLKLSKKQGSCCKQIVHRAVCICNVIRARVGHSCKMSMWHSNEINATSPLLFRKRKATLLRPCMFDDSFRMFFQRCIWLCLQEGESRSNNEALLILVARSRRVSNFDAYSDVNGRMRKQYTEHCYSTVDESTFIRTFALDLRARQDPAFKRINIHMCISHSHYAHIIWGRAVHLSNVSGAKALKFR